MEKIIHYENLRSFAYVNDGICERPIRGMVLSFFGLNGREMYDEDTEEGRFYAQRGILFVVPYNNPWAWMNPQAVAYTDEIVDVLFERYGLAQGMPIVSTGGSMGGLSALVYTAYAARTPAACVANCPVCDLPYHFTERPDLPRTLYSAFFNCAGSLREALEGASPLHLISRMPHVRYDVFHCEEDRAVNKQAHSDRFVKAMQEAGLDIGYHAVPGRGHCDLTEEMRALYRECAVQAIVKAKD